MKPAFWSSLVLATTVVACGGDTEAGHAPAQVATSGETIQVVTEALTSMLPVDGTVRAREQAALSTRMMALHVHAVAPQLASRDIVNLALIDNINRVAVFTVKFSQRSCIKFFHPQLLPVPVSLCFKLMLD